MNPTRTTSLSESLKFHKLMLEDAKKRLKAAKRAVKNMEAVVESHENAVARIEQRLT
jgi:predicted  nucleic acid-binding Zn-ribbon protein